MGHPGETHRMILRPGRAASFGQLLDCVQGQLQAVFRAAETAVAADLAQSDRRPGRGQR